MSIRVHALVLSMGALLSPAQTALAQHAGHHSAGASDSATVAAVVTQYHEALAAGDSARALSLLAADAVILESGGMETRAEYRSHHLPGDIAYARAVTTTREQFTVRVQGDVAWTVSTGVAQGQFRDRAVNSSAAELMVLVRTADGWRITAIHWSSRARRPAPAPTR